MLEEHDLWNGFLTSLDSLRMTSSISKSKAKDIFQKISRNRDHIVVVANLDGRIVGSATLLIETKFIHDGGLAGHIEDVVVDQKFQGQKIGEKLVGFLLEVAKSRGCYKTVLDCTDDLKPFYERVGFKVASSQMRFDHV